MKAEKFNHPLLNMMNSPSSAADVWTRKQQETDEEPAENTAPVRTYDELKKMRRNAYIKMVAIVVLVVAVLAFGSVAWFTESREVEGSGVQMTAENNGFDLQVDGTGTIGFATLYSYLESAISGNSGIITNNETNGQFIRWRMADDDDKLSPGSEGVLEFKVVSRGADISTLRYSLSIRAFVEVTETVQQQIGGEEVSVTRTSNLNEITEDNGTANQKLGAKYLKGHILFFKNRTGTQKGNYQYSGFIKNPDDFELSPDSEGNAVIYWIWVNTFGQIALTSSDNDYIGNNLPVLNAAGETNDRKALTDYLSENAENIFDGNQGQNFANLLTEMYAARTSEEDYQTQFDALSGGYNSADQTIGGFIDYSLVQLIVKPQE